MSTKVSIKVITTRCKYQGKYQDDVAAVQQEQQSQIRGGSVACDKRPEHRQNAGAKENSVSKECKRASEAADRWSTRG
jgi:hypothetical protein